MLYDNYYPWRIPYEEIHKWQHIRWDLAECDSIITKRKPFKSPEKLCVCRLPISMCRSRWFKDARKYPHVKDRLADHLSKCFEDYIFSVLAKDEE